MSCIARIKHTSNLKTCSVNCTQKLISFGDVDVCTQSLAPYEISVLGGGLSACTYVVHEYTEIRDVLVMPKSRSHLYKLLCPPDSFTNWSQLLSCFLLTMFSLLKKWGCFSKTELWCIVWALYWKVLDSHYKPSFSEWSLLLMTDMLFITYHYISRQLKPHIHVYKILKLPCILLW